MSRNREARAHKHYARRPILAAAILLSLLSPLFLAFTAQPAVADTASSSLSAASIGLPKIIPLVGPGASYTITIPAVTSLKWTSLTIEVTWPTQISSGQLEATDVTNNSARLSTISAPADLATPQTWVIPLSGSPNKPSVVQIQSQVLPIGSSVTCGPVVSNLTVRAAPQSVGYDYVGGAQTIASYLTGPIDNLYLRLPAHPSHTDFQTAVQLETALVAHALNRDIAVHLVRHAASLEGTGPLDRVITIDPRRPAGIALVPTNQGGLIISGTNQAQTHQVSVLFGILLPLLQVGHANVVTAPGVVSVPSTTLSLTQLGLANTVAQGVGSFTIPLGFDQAQTGREVQGVSFYLHGTAQAPATGTAATMTAELGNVPVGSTRLASDGAWSISGTLPPTQISRTIALNLVVGYFGGVGSCNQLLPLTVSVDTTSTITVTPGQPLSPPGFLEVPQMLLPTASVVVSDWTFDQLSLAVTLIAGAQRMTGVPLNLTVDPTNTLPATGPALVVATSHSSLESSLRPTRVLNGTAQFTTPNGETDVTIGPNEALLVAGHLPSQAGFLGVIGAASKPSAAADLLNALGSTQNNWLSLTGDTAALAPHNVVVTAQVASPANPTLPQAAKSWLQKPWVLLLLAIVFVLLLILVTPGVLRVLRRRGLGATSPSEVTPIIGSLAAEQEVIHSRARAAADARADDRADARAQARADADARADERADERAEARADADARADDRADERAEHAEHDSNETPTTETDASGDDSGAV